MKVLYIVPGIMAQPDLGIKELERRKKILQSHAQKDTLISITDVEKGPRYIESAYEEYLSVPETVKKAVQAEKDGCDGMILGCFGDPGLDRKLASVCAVNIPVLELGQDTVSTTGRMIEESQKAIREDKADVVVLGCMSMAFMGVSEMMQESLGVPVVNPAVVSLKVLEGLVIAGLSHSKKAYPFPPKKML